MATFSFGPPVQARATKVPISRPTVPPRNDRREKQRVHHACEPCRQRKAKCDGKRPACSGCERLLIQCLYQDGKRELQKRKWDDLEAKIAAYESILQSVASRLGPDEYAALQGVLEGSRVADQDESPSKDQNEHGWDEDSDVEPFEFSATRHLDEDINSLHVNQPMGYMGPSSDASWMHILLAQVDESGGFRDRQEKKGVLTTMGSRNEKIGSTYHLDNVDINLSAFRRHIDAYAIPPKIVADELVTAYFETVHPLVPLVSKRDFIPEYETLYSTGSPYRMALPWMGMLNLIFAMGGRYYETLGVKMDEDHLTYFQRARILGALDGGALFAIPTLNDIRQLCLAGFYLLASKQTNRAWNVIGLTIRMAYGQGLHLRNVDEKLSKRNKEMRVRVWYSIVYMETTLCLFTGRPSGLHSHEYIGPIPQKLSTSTSIGTEFTSNDTGNHWHPDVYYTALMKLAYMTARIHHDVYTRRSAHLRKGPAHCERIIKQYTQRLDEWKDQLPRILKFGEEHEDTQFARKRTDLAFRHTSALIQLHFPDIQLSEKQPDHRLSSTGEESSLQAAKSTIRILVSYFSEEDGKSAGQIAWWCLHHYLMSSEIVILLKVVQLTRNLSDDNLAAATAADFASHRDTAQNCHALLEDARAPLEWLHKVSITDPVASHTYEQLSQIVDRVSARVTQWEEKHDGMEVDGI